MKIGLRFVQFAVAVAVVAMVTTAMAQGQGQRGQRGQRGMGGGGFRISPLTLVQNEAVQKDLDLSSDQKTQITKLADDQAANPPMRGARGNRGAAGPGGAAGAAAVNPFEEVQKKIDEVLLAPQQERFAQIQLQVQSVTAALQDAKVSDKLVLTSDEKDKLTALNTEYQQKRMDLFQQQAGNAGGAQPGGARGRGGAPSPEMTALTNEQNDKAKAILTADQRTAFEKMLGKKLEIDPATLRGGRGQRGNRGGQPGAAAAQPNA